MKKIQKASSIFCSLISEHTMMFIERDLGVKLREAIITKNELVMDVSQLGTGIYFVAVDYQNKRIVKKVVIE